MIVFEECRVHCSYNKLCLETYAKYKPLTSVALAYIYR